MALVERSTSYRIVCNIGKRERHIDREPVLRNSPIHSLGLFANDGSAAQEMVIEYTGTLGCSHCCCALLFP